MPPAAAARFGSCLNITLPHAHSRARQRLVPFRRPDPGRRPGPSCCARRAGRAETVAFAVYGGSLILLYAASTLYHALRFPPDRLRPLRTLDHIAIYFLIAGTYTPVALVTLHGTPGRALLVAAWAHRGGGGSVQDLVAGRAGLALDGDLSGHGLHGAPRRGAARARRSRRAGWRGWWPAAWPTPSAQSSSAASGPIPGPAGSGTTRSGTCWCWSAAGATSRSCCSTWPGVSRSAP